MPNIRPQTEYSACDYRSDELAKEMLANIIGEKSFDIDRNQHEGDSSEESKSNNNEGSKEDHIIILKNELLLMV